MALSLTRVPIGLNRARVAYRLRARCLKNVGSRFRSCTEQGKSKAGASDLPCFGTVFKRAACEYRNCLAANANKVNACEALRHVMDASARAAGHYNGSK